MTLSLAFLSPTIVRTAVDDTLPQGHGVSGGITTGEKRCGGLGLPPSNGRKNSRADVELSVERRHLRHIVRSQPRCFRIPSRALPRDCVHSSVATPPTERAKRS
jgi:hypothetical protein